MISSNEIRNRLADALVGAIPFDSFEDWLVQESWNVHKSSDFALQRLVYAIELRLAERSAEHLSDDQLGRELRALLCSVEVNIGALPEAVSVQGGSSSSFSFQPVPQIRHVDKPHVAAFV